MTHFASTHKTMTKASSSKMKVALGTRKLLSAAVVVWPSRFMVAIVIVVPSPVCVVLGEDEDEHRHEGQVDEVHRLDQADGQEEDREQPALCLRLPGHARDRRASGQSVTDRGADRAASECEATSDEGPRQLNG